MAVPILVDTEPFPNRRASPAQDSPLEHQTDNPYYIMNPGSKIAYGMTCTQYKQVIGRETRLYSITDLRQKYSLRIPVRYDATGNLKSPEHWNIKEL